MQLLASLVIRKFTLYSVRLGYEDKVLLDTYACHLFQNDGMLEELHQSAALALR